MNSLIKKPSAWLPIAMSGGALADLLIALAMGGVRRETDEGTAAHIFQILMGTQVLIILFFAAKWLPQSPKSALKVLALQFLAALIPFALLYIFEHR